MNGFRLWLLGVVLLMIFSGCSTPQLSQHDQLNPEPLNPYLRYLSPEPYWHYNFYPEPRWEYTHGLYSYPNPFSATLYSCHERDKPHWHNRRHRDTTPHKPKPVRPIKPVRTPEPVNRPPSPPTKQPSSGHSPKQSEPKPAKTGASKDEKNLKSLTATAPDNWVTGKPARQGDVLLQNHPDSPEELEKPPSLSNGVIRNNESLRQPPTHYLPADRNSDSTDGEPKAGNDSARKISRDHTRTTPAASGVLDTNPRIITDRNKASLPNNTDISSPSVNRALEKSTIKSIEQSTREISQKNRYLPDSATRNDKSTDRASNPIESAPTIEPPQRQVRKLIEESMEPESARRFNHPSKPAISENFARRTEPREKLPSQEPVRRESNLVRDISRAAEPPVRHETPINREISKTVDSAPARRESPPISPAQKSEPEPKPPMRSESANSGSANEKPNNGMSKKR